MNDLLFSTELKIHPLADIFPMMTDAELDELAADIKANSLLHPIVRTIDGSTICDGRNRYEACQRAGVEPWFDDRIENEEQARALIVSANLQRRNMTKGQQAMALALIYPLAQGRGGAKDRGSIARDMGLSGERLRIARAVFRAAPDDLAPQVLAGALTLDSAFAKVQERLRDAQSDETRMARLQDEAPDLAELVTEDRMKISEATAALDRRIEEEKEREANQRETLIRLTDYAYRGITSWAAPGFVEGLAARIKDPEFRKDFEARVRFDPDQLAEIVKGANALAKFLGRI